ncbi:putative T7SS-secreted protein [Promicromonospora sp. MS192]|uniref:putative T7SS-secreted protein n=1 Tax=Promicromonospora sp. MS192 TaxID=3412684 RepID=UPI003C2E441D
MSAARLAEWNLVGHDSDPVPASPTTLDGIIDHYRKISEAMTEQSALLKRIGDGDVRLLKGKSADAFRKRARESADALGKAGERYADVYSALDTYRPALETARTRTWEGVTAAENASKSLQVAEGMPDPVNADRPEGAKPLTDDEKKDSADRAGAIDSANGKLDAAKKKVSDALAALRAAAEAAATKIRENWKVDGLHTSGWDAFVHGLNKVLKALVEVLTYIGLALAVLAILVPGLNVIAFLGVATAVVSTLASLVLAAQGEGSWLGVILGVLSLVGIGVAAKMASSLKGVQGIGLGVGGASKLTRIEADIAKNLSLLRHVTGRPVASRIVSDKLSKLVLEAKNLRAFLDKTSVSPGWWHMFTKPKWVLKEDWSRLTKAWPKGDYRWDRLIGISDIRDVRKIAGNIGLLGPMFQIKPWMYLGPISYGISWFGRPFSMMNPSILNPDDPRKNNDGWHDANYAGLTGENPV